MALKEQDVVLYSTDTSGNKVIQMPITRAGNVEDLTNTCLPLSGGTMQGGVGHAIISISATSGTVSLTANRIHKMTINGTTTFSLPSVSDTTVFNQIKVMAKVTGNHTIKWGTTQFFNKRVPTITSGNYDFYFDYDPNLNAWVLGALSKGAS